jgi:hypothetical protein
VVESSVCPSCSSPVRAGQILCTVCGELLVAGDAPQPDASRQAARGKAKTTESEVGQVRDDVTPEPAAPAPADEAATTGPTDTPAMNLAVGSSTDPRLAALGIEPAAPAGAQFAPPAAAQFAPPAAAQFAPPAAAVPEEQPEPAEDASQGTMSSYAPPVGAPEPPAWGLHPSHAGSVARSNGPSMSVSAGAVPVSSIDGAASAAAPVEPETPIPAAATPAAPIAPPAPVPAEAPVAAPAPPVSAAQSAIWPPAPVAPETPATGSVASPESAAPPPAPLGSSALPPFAASAGYGRPAPPAAQAAPAPIAAESPLASDASAGKESARELIAFGLVAAGAALGIGSLFLPWANEMGTSVMMTETTAPHQWGWGMPGGIPIFLLSTLVLGAVSGSDRAQARLPNLSQEIGRVANVVLPMILGGLDLGIFLLYWGFPWGFGGGLYVLLLGSVSLIAGAVAALFFPPEVPPEPI